MKTIAIIGGTGGLGVKLTPLLSDYNVLQLGSNDINVNSFASTHVFFRKNDVDIVINMSGVSIDKMMHKITTVSDIRRVNDQIDVNIRGTVNILSACLPKMRANNYGRIIMMSSVVADHPVAGTGVYSGCKGFIDSIVKTVAIENSTFNINCNSIQLGYFDGGMATRYIENGHDFTSSIPKGRLGTIQELANTCRYLIDTEYVNGTNLKINGGILC